MESLCHRLPVKRTLRFALKTVPLLLALFLVIGCDGSGKTGGPVKSKRNIIAGRVMMEDGSPLRGDIKDVVINISGVSGAGEKVSFTPIVKPDGTYSQKVASGLYSFSTGLFCYVVLQYGDIEFHLPLEHVGRNWDKRQDSEDGIVQDFVLKFTGPTPYGKSNGLNIGDAGHWYGESVGMKADSYREDIKASAFKIPAGTKLAFTLKPTGPGIDGQPAKTVTVERVYEDPYGKLDLNDLMPAPYDITGTATLPDGTTKRLLFNIKYAVYGPVLSVPLKKDDTFGNALKQLNAFVIDG